jgi:hypothetical protein
VTLASLPADLKRDWMAPDGRARVEVFPKGDANDNAALQRFTAAGAPGRPRRHRHDGRHPGIEPHHRQGVPASGPVGAPFDHDPPGVWHCARVADVLLTLAPLTLAGLVTLGTCVAIDLPLNFENIIALPLLFGIGVAFSIYFVMAWRSGAANLLQSSLTRAVLFSALTTAPRSAASGIRTIRAPRAWASCWRFLSPTRSRHRCSSFPRCCTRYADAGDRPPHRRAVAVRRARRMRDDVRNTATARTTIRSSR